MVACVLNFKDFNTTINQGLYAESINKKIRQSLAGVQQLHTDNRNGQNLRGEDTTTAQQCKKRCMTVTKQQQCQCNNLLTSQCQNHNYTDTTISKEQWYQATEWEIIFVAQQVCCCVFGKK